MRRAIQLFRAHPAVTLGALSVSLRGLAVEANELAQMILQAEDPANLGSITPLLKDLDAQGLPAVARAASTRGVSDRSFKSSLSEVAASRMASLQAFDVVNVIKSMADLRAYSVTFKDTTADELLARLDEFTGDMLGQALRCFGSMQYYDADLLEGVVEHLAAHPEKFSAENIADIVYAFSKCGFCHPDLVGVVERAAGVLLKEADADSGEAIANIVDAYSRVGCSEPEVVDELIAKVASYPDAMSPTALAKFIVATIRLGYEENSLLKPLLDALVPKLESLPPGTIIKLVNLLGEIGVAHRVLLDELTDKVIPKRLHEFHPSGLSDFVLALNKLGYYNSDFMVLMQKPAAMAD